MESLQELTDTEQGSEKFPERMEKHVVGVVSTQWD